MSDDPRRGRPQAGDAPPGATPDGAAHLLDQAFDADSLYALRAAVAAHGSAAGLSQGRAGDLVIAAHELAANAVRHGAGHGRLRLWQDGDTLHCQVTDDGPAAAGPARPRDHTSPGTNGSLWDSGHGHGLWLVRRVADHTDGHAAPDGTTVTIRFKLGTADTS